MINKKSRTIEWITDIAKQLGVSHSTISDYRNNLKLSKNFKYKTEIEKDNIKLLKNTGKTVEEILK